MISKVMIIGSGQMGSGIAQVFAQAGFTVYLNDIKEEFVQRGLNNITKQLERSVEKGRMSADEKDQVLANLPHVRPACGFICILFAGRVKQRAQCALYGFSHIRSWRRIICRSG